MTRHRSDRQQGSALVESVLILPILIGIGLVASDLFTVSRARSDLERSVATLSGILASQTSLTAAGLDRLVDSVLAGGANRYEIAVGQVRYNGRVAWGVPLGSSKGLCPNPLVKDTAYPGVLPEQDPKDETNAVALLVVQACLDSDALELSTFVLDRSVLKTVSVNRMRTPEPELDTALRQRAGLPPPKKNPE